MVGIMVVVADIIGSGAAAAAAPAAALTLTLTLTLTHSLRGRGERGSNYEFINRLVSDRVIHYYIGKDTVHETVTEHPLSG